MAHAQSPAVERGPDASGIAISWLVSVLRLPELQSLAEYVGIPLRDVEEALGITDTDQLEQALRQMLSEVSPDIAGNWLQDYIQELKNGQADAGANAGAGRDSASPVVEEPVLEPEGGAGSTALIECPACYGEFRPSQAIALGECSHKTCYACAIQTIRGEMSKPDLRSVHCPYCASNSATALPQTSPVLARTSSLGPAVGEGYISQQAVFAVHHWCQRPDVTLPEGVRPFSDEEAERFIAVLVSASLRAAESAEKSFVCPNQRCGKLIVTDAAAVPVEAPCPYCHETLCQACGTTWKVKHEGRTCAEAEDARKRDAALGEFDTGDVAGTFKTCPGCGDAISKFRGHGCHHVTCGRCKGQCCIVCMAAWPCPNDCGSFCGDLCDCPDCDQCTPTHSCPQCSCSMGRGGTLAPPTTRSCCVCCAEKPRDKAARLRHQAELRARRMQSDGWCGPRRVRDGPSVVVVSPPHGGAGGGGGAVAVLPRPTGVTNLRAVWNARTAAPVVQAPRRPLAVPGGQRMEPTGAPGVAPTATFMDLLRRNPFAATSRLATEHVAAVGAPVVPTAEAAQTS